LAARPPSHWGRQPALRQAQRQPEPRSAQRQEQRRSAAFQGHRARRGRQHRGDDHHLDRHGLHGLRDHPAACLLGVRQREPLVRRLVALLLQAALQALARVRASQRPGPGARREQRLAPEPRALVLALLVRDVRRLARDALHHRARGAPRRVHDVRDAQLQAASALRERQREPAQQVARRAVRA
jgi:hypothetical protein